MAWKNHSQLYGMSFSEAIEDYGLILLRIEFIGAPISEFMKKNPFVFVHKFYPLDKAEYAYSIKCLFLPGIGMNAAGYCDFHNGKWYWRKIYKHKDRWALAAAPED